MHDARGEGKWNGVPGTVRVWPKSYTKDKEEMSLYQWLKHHKPGGQNWTQARWEKLNEAFGEGWEKECFPYLETGGWVGQAGSQFGRERDETQWEEILEAVKLFKRTHGRFPRRRGGDAHETRLYTTGCSKTWTPPPTTTPTSAPTSSSWPSATAGSPSASPSPSTPGKPRVRPPKLSLQPCTTAQRGRWRIRTRPRSARNDSHFDQTQTMIMSSPSDKYPKL